LSRSNVGGHDERSDRAEKGRRRPGPMRRLCALLQEKRDILFSLGGPVSTTREEHERLRRLPSVSIRRRRRLGARATRQLSSWPSRWPRAVLAFDDAHGRQSSSSPVSPPPPPNIYIENNVPFHTSDVLAAAAGAATDAFSIVVSSSSSREKCLCSLLPSLT
jgi:hypothetical protein